jgi:hypothetical protein
MPTKTYRKRVELVEALQYSGTNQQELMTFCPWVTTAFDEEAQVSKTYFNDMEVQLHAWVFKDVNGGYAMLEDQMFNNTYQPGGGP